MESEYLTPAEATKLVPSHPTATTIWRWARRGVKARSGKRVFLDHVRFGGKIYVTADGLAKFSEALAMADREHFRQPNLPAIPAPRSESKREREVEAARERLKRAGMA